MQINYVEIVDGLSQIDDLGKIILIGIILLLFAVLQIYATSNLMARVFGNLNILSKTGLSAVTLVLLSPRFAELSRTSTILGSFVISTVILSIGFYAISFQMEETMR